MKQRKMNTRILFISLIVFLLYGCGFQGPSIKKIEGDPAVLYKDGLALFNKADYIGAAMKFNELKSNFPDSPPYTVLAELKAADCRFLQKKYVEALAAYEEFKKAHPSHEEMPYVQYQIGMSSFNQMLTLDRDQTATRKALSSFEYLIAYYPPSLFTEKAKEKAAVCKKRLADSEFYVGDFYYQHNKFGAAVSRFEGLLDKFPKVSEEDKTLYFLGKSYLQLEQWEKAEIVFAKIVAEYPKSLYAGEARTILDKGPEKYMLSGEKAKKPEPRSVEPAPAAPPSAKAAPGIEISPAEEKRMAALPDVAVSSATENEKEKKTVKEAMPPEGEGISMVDKTQPIDITSDKVEAYGKENRIVFKGNVVARQKDIVIFSDSLEAVVMEKGKGIEKVTASGNVKIQQGARLASCQKAVFYNLEQKMVLMGEPRVSEKDNVVSGDEITFDIAKNQVHVKGGSSGRGKVRVQQTGDLKKLQ